MNEKEKKAIESMKEFAYTIHGTLSVKEAQIILNLIENQKAEIEKLRNNNKDLLRKLRNRVKEVKKLTKYSLYKKEFLTLNEHLKKKDKIIDEMAKCIDIELSSSRLGIILNKNVKPLESYKKDIKQYYERKVENGN